MRSKRISLFSSNYWPGFTDLMSSLLLLFIFLGFYQFFAKRDYWNSKIIVEKQNELKEAFQDSFPKKVMDSLITITSDGNLQRISYSSELLFRSAEVELINPYYLDRSAQIFKSIGTDLFKVIQVEGFTDSILVTERNKKLIDRGIKNNWDLSVARAAQVVRRLQDLGIEPKLLSATGYSWYQSPSNRTEEDRARNRKIEIILVYSLLDVADAPKTSIKK